MGKAKFVCKNESAGKYGVLRKVGFVANEVYGYRCFLVKMVSLLNIDLQVKMDSCVNRDL